MNLKLLALITIICFAGLNCFADRNSSSNTKQPQAGQPAQKIIGLVTQHGDQAVLAIAPPKSPEKIFYAIVDRTTNRTLGLIKSKYFYPDEKRFPLDRLHTMVHWSPKHPILVLEEELNGDSPSFARVFDMRDAVQELQFRSQLDRTKKDSKANQVTSEIAQLSPCLFRKFTNDGWPVVWWNGREFIILTKNGRTDVQELK